MPEREVAVCSADEGQQARNSCPELCIFFLLASHGIISSSEDHLSHLKAIILRIDVCLKLKPTKCTFAQRELEYLGHVVSRDGWKANPRLIAAVKEFPTPLSAHDVFSLVLRSRLVLPEVYCMDCMPTPPADV